jgi:hypothetical protein
MRQRSVASPIRCAPEAGAWQLIVSRKAVLLFRERLIYEQSAARTVREQQEKRSCDA